MPPTGEVNSPLQHQNVPLPLAVLALERSLASNIRDEIYAIRNIPVTLGMLYFSCATTRGHH